MKNCGVCFILAIFCGDFFWLVGSGFCGFFFLRKVSIKLTSYFKLFWDGGNELKGEEERVKQPLARKYYSKNG